MTNARIRRLRAAALCGAMVLEGCAAQPWTTHKDPSGFTVSLPPGWKAAADAESGRVSLTGPAQERALVWPLFLPGGVNPASAGILLRRLVAPAGFGAYRWSEPRPVAAQAVRMDGVSGGQAAVASLAWSASPKGTASTVFVTAAPRAAYPQAVFSRILGSFRVAGGAAGKPASDGLTFVPWRDPLENAFTVEVPAGWAVEGGMYRLAAVDTRAALNLASPDRQIRITFGDKDIGGFVEPNQTLEWAGFHEGSVYSPGYGVQNVVRRYIPGPVFVRQYIAMRPARGCANLQITEARARPDADEAVNRLYQGFLAYSMKLEQHSGEASFTCEEGGRAMAGYYFAGTLSTRSSQSPVGNWMVQYLFGFVAAKEKVSLAQQVVRHIVASMATNPEWARRQGETTLATSRIVADANQAVSKIIDDTYWTRQHSQDEIGRRRSNAILGLEDVVDPRTGRQMKVESGSNYYWIDNRGVIAGTETASLPGLDFRALTALP